MNLQAPEATEGESRQNTVFDANVAFDVGPLKLDGKYIRQAENFVATADVHAFNSIEAGVATDFLLGIDLGGRFYRKSTGEEANEEVLNAYLLTAKKGFELGGLPVTVDARYAGASQGEEDEDKVHNIFAKLGFEKKADLGLRYGASASYEKHVLDKANWKGFGSYGEDTVANLAANVGYILDWRGALVDLGYSAGLKMPIVEEEDESIKELTHKLSVGYNFTKDVKLTLGSTIVQTFEEPVENDFTYNAGLTISF
ncbi:MAG TPA: hypothetical protein GX521_02880 [Firmicutes bacterium]|nr:hypothetical protein [Bacillota bacterium]